MNFWENLKSECDRQNIFLKELAEKSGVNYGTIKNSITRNSNPSVEIAYKLANVLNVSIDFLLTGKHPDNKEVVKLKDQIKELETKLELIRQIVT